MADANDDLADITVGDATALATMLREWRAFKAGGEVPPSQSYAGEQRFYLEIVSKTGEPHENRYRCRLYCSPYGGIDLTYGNYVTAWNLREYGNGPTSGHDTSTPYNMDGYEITPEADAVCGSYTGMDPAPTGSGQRYPVIDYRYREADDAPGGTAEWGYVFEHRRDPIVKMTDD